MNISDYLTNPMGKGASVLNISTIRKSLDDDYKKLNQRMSVKWYSIDDMIYIAHVKIPSRKHEKLFYDVVVQFTIESIDDIDNLLTQVDAKVFSNCPSFTYTYAYVFKEKGNLIDWARVKYNKKILSKTPEMRNPDKVLSYERSLYFGFKYISSSNRHTISHVKATATRIRSHRYVLSLLKSNDMIENLYQEYDGKLPKEEVTKKKTDVSKKDPEKRENDKSKKGVNKTTAKVKTTKKTKSTKKTHRI